MKLLLLFSLLCLYVFEADALNSTTVNATKSYGSVTPTWLTSPYFRAGNQAVIQTLTGNSQTPTFTFTFSSPLTGMPQLAYGIKNYRGNDYLGQEFYEIKKIGLTQGTFTVSIQIYGVTNLWLLTVAYLAVEPTFPHHFNTFDNVPLNYSSGAIVNISTASQSLTYFTQYINYTQQAAARPFNTFTAPLSSNIIVLFMTSLWIQGSFGFPLQFHITPTVLSTNMYSLNATVYTKVKITNVHFSQVIFNKIDIQDSQKYQVVYYEWDNGMNGGWRSLPYEFMDNFIMGVTAFQLSDAQCGFQYQWEFANSTAGVFGVQLLKSWTINNYCGFSYSQTSILYIQTWQCDPPYIYFNLTTELCQDLCGGYYIENPVIGKCQQCTNPLCYQCLPNNDTLCTECAAFDHLQLVDNYTCACMTGYFYLQGNCATCATGNPGCLNCSYYAPISATDPFNSSDFQCYDCDQTQNYFLVNTSCQLCTIPYCVTCSSLTSCSACASGYSIDFLLTCSTCAVLGCFQCDPNNNNYCNICYATGGYFLIPATHQCTSICGDGLTAAGLEACDDGNTINEDGCSSACLFEPFFNCTLLANFTTVCLPVCGDGVKNGKEGCDDGNLIDSDGCNSLCQLQIVVELTRQTRSLNLCNSLEFSFSILPYYSFLDSFNFSALILLNSIALINPQHSYSQNNLFLSYDFTEDMGLKQISIVQNTTLMQSYSAYSFLFSQTSFEVKPDNNVAANYMDQASCAEKETYQGIYKIMEIASFTTLFISMVPGKIIGLELFGVLQLAYFSVGSIDSVNMLLTPLMDMKGLNGLSIPFLESSTEPLPRRVKQIKYYTSFLDNFNVMFIVLFAQIVLAIFFYLIAKVASPLGKTLINFANKLLKQIFLTLVFFNCFNISYATAIYFRYSESYDIMSLVASLMSVGAMIFMTVMIVYANPDGFGEFKDKFKGDAIEGNYMAISIVYRSLVGFLLAFSNDDDLSTLFSLGLSLLFVMYNLINLPFRKAYHNYRACLCHLTQFITLFVAMYYRSMKSTSSPSEVATIFSPAKIQFAFLLTTLAASILVLIYDTYLFLKGLTCFYQQVRSPKNDIIISREDINPKEVDNSFNYMQAIQEYSAPQ